MKNSYKLEYTTKNGFWKITDQPEAMRGKYKFDDDKNGIFIKSVSCPELNRAGFVYLRGSSSANDDSVCRYDNRYFKLFKSLVKCQKDVEKRY